MPALYFLTFGFKGTDKTMRQINWFNIQLHLCWLWKSVWPKTRTQCGTSGAKSLDTHNSDVLLTLTLVSLGMVNHHVLTHLTVNCSRAHASDNRMWPVFLDKKAVQELWVRDGLCFLDAQKKFLQNKPEIRTELCASALCHQHGIDAATQTTSLPSQGNTLMPPWITVSTQSEVST
jgi:hypothetical protein